jgi:hypothetical protein
MVMVQVPDAQTAAGAVAALALEIEGSWKSASSVAVADKALIHLPWPIRTFRV